MGKQTQEHIPLAERMRPSTFADFVGQTKIIGKGMPLRALIEKDYLVSAILFWGPPGVGKTTLASLIAHETKSAFIALSGVLSGKADLEKAIQAAKILKEEQGQQTILFVDEIHRWNKAQQDALLPYVEKGIVTLIGATTENPSFSVIGPLLSRSQVYVLTLLEDGQIKKIITRALQDKEKGFGEKNIDITESTLDTLAALAGGDARRALNCLEIAVNASSFAKASKDKTKTMEITEKEVKAAAERSFVTFDKKGEEFYNTISALHKSMRGSDANAALYWLARMLEGGADPMYLARRILRFASEDVGMANSEALVQATAAMYACEHLGMPECSVHLAQAVVYCAKAKKSNVLYMAYLAAAADARETSHLGVPFHLRNAPTKLMKDLDYGKGYKYNPDFKEPVEQKYLPDELKGREYLK